MKNIYSDYIMKECARRGYPDIDPRHVEAFIRVARPTFNGLSDEEFKFEIEIGIGCVLEAGPIVAEHSAQSWGL